MKILVLAGSHEEFLAVVRPAGPHEYRFARDWRDLNGYRGADQVVILPGFFVNQAHNFQAEDTLTQLPVYMRDPLTAPPA